MSGPAGVGALLRESLLRNSAMLLLASVELAAGGFLFWQLVAHLFPAAEVGRASVLISASTLISTLALLGMNNSLIRYLSEWPDRARTVNSGTTLVAGAAAAGAVGFAAGTHVLAPELTALRHPAEVAVFVGLTVAAAVSMVNDNLFVALRRSGFVLSRNSLVVALRLALPFALLGGSAFGIFAAYWLAVAVALIPYLVVLARSFGLPPRLRASAGRLRAMWRYSAGNYLATAILMMPSLLMPILVAHRTDAAHAAYYYIASLVASVQALVPQATARSFFAEVMTGGGRLRELLPRVLGLTAALQLPVLLVLVVAGRFVLRLFGAEYARAYPLLVLLAVTLTLSSVGFVGSTLLLISGRLRLLVQVSLAGCAVSLTGSFLLADRGLVWVGGSMLAGEVVLTLGYAPIIGAAMHAGRLAAAAAGPDPADPTGTGTATGTGTGAGTGTATGTGTGTGTG